MVVFLHVDELFRYFTQHLFTSGEKVKYIISLGGIGIVIVDIYLVCLLALIRYQRVAECSPETNI